MLSRLASSLTQAGPRSAWIASPLPWLRRFRLLAATAWALALLCGFTLKLWEVDDFMGLLVRLSVPSGSCPHVEPIRVRLDDAMVSINARPSSWEALPRTLRQELAMRPLGCPVVVDGSADVDWHSVARAIDVIRGVGADVVMAPHHH